MTNKHSSKEDEAESEQPLRTIEWISETDEGMVPGFVRMIDQTRLPEEQVFIEARTVDEIWSAIQTLQVRGAPAIGIAAAMGVVIAIQEVGESDTGVLIDAVNQAALHLSTSRPTAVNLFWALERMKRVARAHWDLEPGPFRECLAKEALAVRDEDAAMCRAIGEYGVKLLKTGQTILTHCNAGGLATAEFGTALAPVYVGKAKGMKLSVIADETRPLLQGSRLTAWELQQAGVDVTLICDNMAAQVMREGRVDVVMVGSDRIAANGDAANKIGTYGLAVLAKAHGIPFYVLAPTSTVDILLSSGEQIPIEERDAAEITCGFGKRTAPKDIKVYAPAFDVTPSELITAIISEKGIARAPYADILRDWVGGLDVSAPTDEDAGTDRGA